MKPTRIEYLPKGYRFTKEELASSYELFVEFLRWRMNFGYSPFPDYKHYIFDAMDKASRPESYVYKLLIMEPRSHAKTTCDIIPYAPWRWLSDPSLRVGVWSQGDPQAKKIVKGIINIITTYLPEYYSVKSVKKQELDLYHHKPHQLDPSLECFPILGTSSVGSGKDLIILDDVYTTQNANTEIKAQSIKNNVADLEDLFRETKYPQTVVVGTRLGEEDLYADIIKDKRTKSFIFPMIPPDKQALIPDKFESVEQAEEFRKYCIWQDMMQADQFFGIWNDKRRRMSQYLLEPASAAQRVFNMSCVEYVETKFPVNSFENYIIMMDPAGGSSDNKRSDDFAMPVIGFGTDGLWHVVDGWASNEFKQEEMLEAWIALLRKWSKTHPRTGRTIYPTTYYEKHGIGANLYMPLKTQIEKEKWGNNRKPIYGTSKSGNIQKEVRIETFLSALVHNNLLVIHKSPISETLIDQMTKFSTAVGALNHDDVVDSVAAGVAKLCRLNPQWAKKLSDMDDRFLATFQRVEG